MIEDIQRHNPASERRASAHPSPPQQPRVFTHVKKAPEGWNNVASTVAVLLLAPLVALFLTAFVFQSYQVDGESMQKTLDPNDRLLVWKAPKTWARITGHPYIPKRGDVVIFAAHALEGFGLEQDKQLIKRVIGLPGERVTIKNGTVTVYNSEYPQGFQPDKILPYGNAISPTPGSTDIVIPKNEVFVLGDNRGNSSDSSEFGPIAASDIVGKLAVRILPLNQFQRF